MKVVLQRVSQASVTIEEQVVGQINKGFLLLVGICDDDTEADLDYLVKKISQLRVFEDEAGKMNLGKLTVPFYQYRNLRYMPQPRRGTGLVLQGRGNLIMRKKCIIYLTKN